MGMGGRALCLDQPRSRALRLGQTWEVPAWKIAHFEVTNRENTLRKLTFWKMPFGSRLLEK